jgi:hypothetical protein
MAKTKTQEQTTQTPAVVSATPVKVVIDSLNPHGGRILVTTTAAGLLREAATGVGAWVQAELEAAKREFLDGDGGAPLRLATISAAENDERLRDVEADIATVRASIKEALSGGADPGKHEQHLAEHLAERDRLQTRREQLAPILGQARRDAEVGLRAAVSARRDQLLAEATATVADAQAALAELLGERYAGVLHAQVAAIALRRSHDHIVKLPGDEPPLAAMPAPTPPDEGPMPGQAMMSQFIPGPAGAPGTMSPMLPGYSAMSPMPAEY